MDYIDLNGVKITPGQVAKVQINNNQWKTGAVSQTNEGLITVRCNITEENPDGVLFSATPTKTHVLIP